MFDRIASAVQSDCVRRPIRLRSPSDQIAFAIYSYKHRMYTLSTKSDSNTLLLAAEAGDLRYGFCLY